MVIKWLFTVAIFFVFDKFETRKTREREREREGERGGMVQ